MKKMQTTKKEDERRRINETGELAKIPIAGV